MTARLKHVTICRRRRRLFEFKMYIINVCKYYACSTRAYVVNYIRRVCINDSVSIIYPTFKGNNWEKFKNFTSNFGFNNKSDFEEYYTLATDQFKKNTELVLYGNVIRDRIVYKDVSRRFTRRNPE